MTFLRTNHTAPRGQHVKLPGEDPQVSARSGQGTALEVRDLTLRYPDGVGPDGAPRTMTALDHVDFAAEAGTMIAVTGPSGSGKSSLLAVASTLVKPTSGAVLIAGRAVEDLKDAQLAALRRESIGTVFQQPNLIPSLTAQEQLVVTAHLRGARGRKLKRARIRAADLLELVGLGEMAGRRPHELSGGQRQRVNIARAIMGNPSVLLVDEPTSALDQERSEEIMRLLQRLTRDFRLATVVVTHDLEFVDLADRRVVMVDGTLTEG